MRVLDKTMSNELICVAPDAIDKIWLRVVDFIEIALIKGHSDYNSAHIYNKLRLGESLLWIVHDGPYLAAVGTTEICSLNGSGRGMVITTCAGRDMKSWKKFRADLEQYARDEKCDWARLYGRPGWKRALRNDGYVEPWIVLEKRLS